MSASLGHTNIYHGWWRQVSLMSQDLLIEQQNQPERNQALLLKSQRKS